MAEPALRVIHLALSIKGARALDDALKDTLENVEWPDAHNGIYTAIRADLKEQLPAHKKKAKRGA